MASNIMPATWALPTAKVGARLCNFVTACDFLLVDHQNWLDANLQPVIHGMQGPWVDLKGLASHLGDANHYNNQALSERRVRSVENWVSNYAKQINFQRAYGVGSSEDPGGIQDNDGYYRAVEIAVYATKPPAPKPEPKEDGSRYFEIRVLTGISGGKDGAQGDGYLFQIVDPKARQAAICAFGGAGMSLGVSWPVSAIFTPGPATPFRTTQPVRLPDFEGPATLYSDPGAGIGPFSLGGALRLSFNSHHLTEKGAYVLHEPLKVEGGWGFQISGAIAGDPLGYLKVWKIEPYLR